VNGEQLTFCPDRELAEIGARSLSSDDPRLIGPFPIRAVLGSGGMGRVYLGLGPAGYVAVKRVRPDLADDDDFLVRFGQELDSQARLPAGVSARLLAADRTARPPWFATEYVPGVTVQDAVRLAGGRLPVAACWVLLRELAARLRVLAGLGMVHRDLKPSNIMLTSDGVTLIDFGLALAGYATRITGTGMLVGTPSYMAPEQARADKTLTPAVDVFSLGCVIAFAATGQLPFGEDPALLYRIVSGEPDLAALRELDPGLAGVVGSCLAKDPADRPTAAELAAPQAAPGVPAWPAAVAALISLRGSFATTAPLDQDVRGEAPEPVPTGPLFAAPVPTQSVLPEPDAGLVPEAREERRPFLIEIAGDSPGYPAAPDGPGLPGRPP
jgi:serine/threonine protein kinase